MARVRKAEVPATVDEPKVFDGPALLALIKKFTDQAPPEAWAELPADLAQKFEEYEYGGKPWPR